MKGMGYGDDTGVLVGCEGGMHGMERKEICEDLMHVRESGCRGNGKDFPLIPHSGTILSTETSAMTDAEAVPVCASCKKEQSVVTLRHRNFCRSPPPPILF